MHYALLKKTAASNLDDDSDQETRLGENLEDTTCFPAFQRTITRILPVLSSIIIPLLCVLLVIDITIRLQNRDFDNPWRIRSKYGRDTAYMSLDHKFDVLWNDDLAANSATIMVPLTAQGDLQSDGLIGMCVFIFDAIFFSTDDEQVPSTTLLELSPKDSTTSS